MSVVLTRDCCQRRLCLVVRDAGGHQAFVTPTHTVWPRGQHTTAPLYFGKQDCILVVERCCAVVLYEQRVVRPRRRGRR